MREQGREGARCMDRAQLGNHQGWGRMPSDRLCYHQGRGSMPSFYVVLCGGLPVLLLVDVGAQAALDRVH